jgi:hypothetical protein
MDDQLSLNYWIEKLGKLENDLAATRAEIERLNGRRCDGCKHGYFEIDGNEMTSCLVWSGYYDADHYCKSWEGK